MRPVLSPWLLTAPPYLLLAEQVLGGGVVGLLMPRQLHLGGWDVHLVAAQDGVGILLGPEVVVRRGAVLGLTGLDPAHLDGVDQLGDLWGREEVKARSQRPQLAWGGEEEWDERVEMKAPSTALQPWEPGGAAQDRRSRPRVYTWTQTAAAGAVVGAGGPRRGREGLLDRRMATVTGLQRCRLRGGSRRKQSSALRSRPARGSIRPLTFSFSMREGMKLRLSAGRFVTGWIMTSWVKKSTAGWGDTDPWRGGSRAPPARPAATRHWAQARGVGP